MPETTTSSSQFAILFSNRTMRIFTRNINNHPQFWVILSSSSCIWSRLNQYLLYIAWGVFNLFKPLYCITFWMWCVCWTIRHVQRISCSIRNSCAFARAAILYWNVSACYGNKAKYIFSIHNNEWQSALVTITMCMPIKITAWYVREICSPETFGL